MKRRQIPTKPTPEAYSQRLVLAVLMDAAQRGEHLTSRQIGERTANKCITINGVRVKPFPISDPRSSIRCLRQRGFEIADAWDTNDRGKGFKRYWLADPKQATAPQRGKEANNE